MKFNRTKSAHLPFAAAVLVFCGAMPNAAQAYNAPASEANSEQHEQNPEQPVPRGFWHPEEWQSMVHKNHWACFRKKPFVWGTFVWNMFDFCAARRAEGGTLGLNDKGLVTFDRTLRKDAFYFYKANWSASPLLYITSRCHKVRNEPVTPVKVYSNQGPVKLSVNGKMIATVEPSGEMICKWDHVVLAHGENHVRVEANGFIDEVVWVVDPNAKSGKPETGKAKRIEGDGGVGADGK